MIPHLPLSVVPPAALTRKGVNTRNYIPEAEITVKELRYVFFTPLDPTKIFFCGVDASSLCVGDFLSQKEAKEKSSLVVSSSKPFHLLERTATLRFVNSSPLNLLLRNN